MRWDEKWATNDSKWTFVCRLLRDDGDNGGFEPLGGVTPPFLGTRGFRLPWLWNRASVHARDAPADQRLIASDEIIVGGVLHRFHHHLSALKNASLYKPERWIMIRPWSCFMTYFLSLHRGACPPRFSLAIPANRQSQKEGKVQQVLAVVPQSVHIIQFITGWDWQMAR